MNKRLTILLLSAFYALAAAAEGHPFQKMAFERLPDLGMPIGVGQAVLLDGEITVFGGHTTGYKPVETAEYYAGGTWHSIPMNWPHDGGCVAVLPDGKVFLTGGNAEAFGIGQSFGAEIYDPDTHSFKPLGIMDRKRSLHKALALPDGRVLIAGNWHGPDGIEAYSPKGGFSFLKSLEPGLTYPYILPCAGDDFLIFGSMDSYGNKPVATVQRLEGEPFIEPLLEEWLPVFNYVVSDDEQKIADYTYLLLASRRDWSETAILKVADGVFSLLELETPIPCAGPSGDPILWTAGPQVDRASRVAWIQGNDVAGRIYFARIDYNATLDGGKAAVQCHYAETSGGFPLGKALLLPGGKMLLAGGTRQVPGDVVIVEDNFNTFSSVYVFHTEDPRKASAPVWAIVAGIVLIGGASILIVSRLRRKNIAGSDPDAEESVQQARKLNTELMAEMSRLIEEKELFLRNDLRADDIAKELATNRTYLSFLVNNLTGSGFSDLINGYRIRYAQQLMREHPGMAHGDVAIASGFSSRTAFLRTFKAKTGLSPTEWKANREKSPDGELK